MPKELKKIFEKEYMAKGKTKAEADRIFYATENKLGHLYPKKKK